jgi:uncharacterized repeat protein (TIGR01451 family)
MKFPDYSLVNTSARLLAKWALILLIAPQISWAAGTLAGTSISNTAVVSYSMAAIPQPDISATSTAILVDEKIDLTVTGGVITNVASASLAQVTAFTVTNTANSPLDFSLTVVDAIPVGDNFDPISASCAAYEDHQTLGTVGVYDTNDTATFINELPADASRTVFVVCDIPATALGNTALVGLIATARGDFNPAGYVATPGLGSVIVPGGANSPNVDIVYGDIAGTDDATFDAQHSARNTYTIGGASVAVTKTASVADPNGTAVVMPGAVITYQIVVTVSGSGTANSLVIDDPLPANTTYVANSIILDGGAQTDANDPLTDNTDFGFTAPNTVTVSLGNVAAPANHVITFRATIN